MSRPVAEDELPPHNLEVERHVLGSLLLDNEAFHVVAPILRPEDFYRDSHQALYRVMLEMNDQADPVDASLLDEELARQGLLGKVGGPSAIHEILAGTPHAANARQYAQIVAGKATARRVIAIASEAIREGYSNGFSSDELLARLDAAVAELSASRLRDETRTAHDAVTASLVGLQGRIDGVAPGVPTGLSGLDDYLGGLRPGRLIVIAARPSIGKSSLVTTILANAAAAGFPVLLFSMEMDHAEIGDRLICGHSGVDGYKYTNPYRMQDADHAAVADSAEEVSRYPIHIDDDSSRTIRQIVAKSRRAVARDGIRVIAVDYLQLLDADDARSRDSRAEFIARCSRALKKMADELKVPVILVSQLNREAEKRDKKRPALADLRESGAIEQDANVVALIHRPDFYDPDDMPGVTEVIIAKNRGGRTGTVKLGFRKGQTRFVDYREPAPGIDDYPSDEPFG